MHNDIPKPDRTKDNSTLWQADYDRAHYENMYFNRMRKFYERESNGKFTIDGDDHRVGEGPLQPGPLRPQREQHHRSSCVTRWPTGSTAKLDSRLVDGADHATT